MAARSSKKAPAASRRTAQRKRGTRTARTAVRSGTREVEVGSGQAVVRMYRQGLGDCFLVFLPRPGDDDAPKSPLRVEVIYHRSKFSDAPALRFKSSAGRNDGKPSRS